MNAKLGSATPTTPARYRVDDLLIDIERQRVTRDGAQLDISGLSFELLLVLLRAAPNLVSIDELMEQVWPGVVVGSEAVTQRIKLIRQALGDQAQQPRYVAGVRGRGYRLVASVRPLPTTATLDGLAPVLAESANKIEAIANEAADAIDATIAKRPSWRPMALLFGVLVTMACVWWGLTHISSRNTKTSTPVVARNSIAVLPFVNYTGDATKDYLGEGMAEELINTLSKVPGLKVPARTSSFAYKGRNADVRQIAKDLGVGTILEGSVRSAGERIRITAQLVNAQDGLHLWSENYDRKFTDLFKLQDELATAIVTALQVNLNGASPAVTRAPPTQDVEAYQLYLQGRSMLDRPTVQNLNRAIELFNQVIARDPKFARAYAGIAIAHSQRTLAWTPGDHFAIAERAAQRALTLDPNENEAQLVLGMTSAFHGDYLQTDVFFRKALALAENDGQIHALHAAQLMSMGHLREALNEARRGYALAPANPITVMFLAYVNWAAGADAEAQRWADLAVDIGFQKSQLGDVYGDIALHAKQYAEAADVRLSMHDMKDQDQARAAEVIKLVYAALADPAQRNTALAARSRLYPQKSRPAPVNTFSAVEFCTNAAYSYVALGAIDMAYDLGNQCLDLGRPYGGTALQPLWTPEMRLFRQDPRFQAYATRLGLMAYWQQHGPPDECDLQDGKLACH